jgi:PhnB protein
MTENNVRPKLVLPDAGAALDFYRDALGSQERARYTHGDTVVFAEIEVFGTVLTLKDADAHDPVTHPGPLLDVVHDDPDSVVSAIVDAGGEVVFAVADQPYGARGGRARDPFGVQWLVQTPLELSADEVQRRLDQA